MSSYGVSGPRIAIQLGSLLCHFEVQIAKVLQTCGSSLVLGAQLQLPEKVYCIRHSLVLQGGRKQLECFITDCQAQLEQELRALGSGISPVVVAAGVVHYK